MEIFAEQGRTRLTCIFASVAEEIVATSIVPCTHPDRAEISTKHNQDIGRTQTVCLNDAMCIDLTEDDLQLQLFVMQDKSQRAFSRISRVHSAA